MEKTIRNVAGSAMVGIVVDPCPIDHFKRQFHKTAYVVDIYIYICVQIMEQIT